MDNHYTEAYFLHDTFTLCDFLIYLLNWGISHIIVLISFVTLDMIH